MWIFDKNPPFQPSPEKIASPEQTTATPPEVDARYSPQIIPQSVSLNLSPIGTSESSTVESQLESPAVGPISTAIQNSLEYPTTPADYSNYYSAFYQSHYQQQQLQAAPNHHFTVSSLIQKVNPGAVWAGFYSNLFVHFFLSPSLLFFALLLTVIC